MAFGGCDEGVAGNEACEGAAFQGWGGRIGVGDGSWGQGSGVRGEDSRSARLLRDLPGLPSHPQALGLLAAPGEAAGLSQSPPAPLHRPRFPITPKATQGFPSLHASCRVPLTASPQGSHHHALLQAPAMPHPQAALASFSRQTWVPLGWRESARSGERGSDELGAWALGTAGQARGRGD